MVNKNKKRVIGICCAVLLAVILLGTGLAVFHQGQKKSPDTSKENISAEAELPEEKEDAGNPGNSSRFDGADNLDNTDSVSNSDNADADPADNDVSFDTVRKEDSSSMTVTEKSDVTISPNGNDVKAKPSSTQSPSENPAASSDPEWSNDY